MAVGRQRMITDPLSEIEKAELSTACSAVLTPVGLLLLRRALFQLDVLSQERAELLAALKGLRALIVGECGASTYECVDGERADEAIAMAERQMRYHNERGRPG